MGRVHRAGLQRAMAYTNARVGVVEGESQQYTEEQLRRFGPGAYLGLVRNGAGITGNNDNFTGATFVRDSLVAGGGSFEFVAAGFADDLIAVDPHRPLRFSFYARAVGDEAPGLFYSAVATYDLDGLVINAPHWLYRTGSLTTLTQPLRRGDLAVHLASTAAWADVHDNNEYERGVLAWGYRNSAGYTYPVETYSRRASLMAGAWYIAKSPRSVTLLHPWPYDDVPAGTPVSNGMAGNSYTYIGALAATLTPTWTHFEGRTIGMDSSANRTGLGLTPGTAFVRPYFFNTTGARFRLNMVQLSEIVA